MSQAKAAFAATALLAAHAALRAADLPFTRGELLNPWELHRELRVDPAVASAVKEFFLSFSDYQDFVLFHPTLGYYSSGRVSFTQDYRTFPDALSPYFGQMVAQHIFEMWVGMRKAGTLIANEPFTIAEFGAGDGEMAESILTYADRRAAQESPAGSTGASELGWSEFARQTVYACYDRSASLSERQSYRNARFGKRFEAREGDATDPTATIPAGSLKGVVLSNELPDAFSVQKVVLSPSGSAEVAFVAPTLTRTSWSKLEKDLPAPLQERLKTEDRIIQTRIFGRKRETTTYLSRAGFEALLKAFTSAGNYAVKIKEVEFREIYIPIETVPELADHVRKYIPAYAYELARGNKAFAAYINLGEARFIQGAGRVLKSGYVLTIDYGANWDGVSPIEFDHLRTYGPGTRRERPDPYHLPTLNDITTDVNFSHLVEEGRLVGLRPIFYGSQHTLLTGTPILLETPPAERGDLVDGDLQDYQAWVQSFYTWDVFKVLVQQKENTDAAYAFPDNRAEPLTVQVEDLTKAQQATEMDIEQKLRERLAASPK